MVSLLANLKKLYLLCTQIVHDVNGIIRANTKTIEYQ